MVKGRLVEESRGMACLLNDAAADKRALQAQCDAQAGEASAMMLKLQVLWTLWANVTATRNSLAIQPFLAVRGVCPSVCNGFVCKRARLLPNGNHCGLRRETPG